MIDIETKRILNRFADIADRYVAVQEKYYKLISEPGFVASEPKSSCCSVHAGSSEALRDYQAMNLAWVANLVRKTSLENRSVHAGTSEECR